MACIGWLTDMGYWDAPWASTSEELIDTAELQLRWRWIGTYDTVATAAMQVKNTVHHKLSTKSRPKILPFWLR